MQIIEKHIWILFYFANLAALMCTSYKPKPSPLAYYCPRSNAPTEMVETTDQVGDTLSDAKRTVVKGGARVGEVFLLGEYAALCTM